MAFKEDDSFRSFVVVDDVVVVVVVKSKMMSLFVARASVWLAAGGTNPSTGRIIINDDANIINAATMQPAIGVDDGDGDDDDVLRCENGLWFCDQ